MVNWTNIKEEDRPDYEVNWAKDAIEVQDASNLVGVVNSFIEMLRVMRIGFMMDEKEVRNHPAVILFSDKIADMTNRPGPDDYHKAYHACKARSAMGGI